ncbi:hypothetical protein [Streptomyces diastatochromogenes]|uniref:hypothetical protein n=1 Tax=Streptomyces diastatochromogenes TaxID=42236 RepID=UPI001ABF6318|nr:hypothetical protein [Streptomyces diastatochromogenes]MCZ0984956.1 hypothetical protein [Streptomyces diastatochromogenes]
MKAAVLTAPERIETVDEWPEPVRVIEAGFPLGEAREAFAGAAGRAGKTWIGVGGGHA